MTGTITLSGWGQAHDALASVTADNTNHFDYSNFKNIKELFASLENYKPELVIGWSLGGQIAIRAISEGVFRPKALILLAAPYQFVASKEIKCAMDKDNFNLFHRSFTTDPIRALKRFIALVSLNDSKAHEILTELKVSITQEQSYKWLYWLEELERFSCNEIDFSIMPKVFAIHGRDDTIVDVTQTGLFRSLIPHYNLEIFNACGHAPHIHNKERVREIIKSAL